MPSRSHWSIAYPVVSKLHVISFSPASGTLSVEAIYQDRDQFAQLVREVAAPDVGRMGIEILSFTIKDVYDNVEYLQSLGRAQTANVKRDADIGVAEANRDAGIRVSETNYRDAGIRVTGWVVGLVSGYNGHVLPRHINLSEGIIYKKTSE